MKQLKSFIPFRIDDGMYKWLGVCAKTANTGAFNEKIEENNLHSIDPIPSSWGCGGLRAVMPGESNAYVHDLDGTARMLVYRFSDRNLPAAVINEHLSKKIAKFSERQARAPNKSEYMEMKDTVVLDLLPKAFIRRTMVPVLVFKDLLLIYTASFKKAEDVLIRMRQLANLKASVVFEPRLIETVQGRMAGMKDMAQGARLGEDDPECFAAGDIIKIKGADKRVFTVKDFSIDHVEVQSLVDSDAHAVVELGIDYADEGSNFSDPDATFVMTQAGMFKAIKLAATRFRDIDAADQHATCWITATLHKRIHDGMLELLGGEQAPADMNDDDL